MPRHHVTVTIEDDNRDKGKVFVLTEMDAIAAEKWAMRLAYLVSQAGVTLDPALLKGGMAALSEVQKADVIAFSQAISDESLAGWWDCVRYQHKPDAPPQKIVLGPNCQIEEISTIGLLRGEVVALHLGFSETESPSISVAPSPTPTGSSPTQISRPRSAR